MHGHCIGKNKRPVCKYSILVELPDWYRCPNKCPMFGTAYCMQFLASEKVEQLSLLKGGEKDDGIMRSHEGKSQQSKGA